MQLETRVSGWNSILQTVRSNIATTVVSVYPEVSIAIKPTVQ